MIGLRKPRDSCRILVFLILFLSISAHCNQRAIVARAFSELYRTQHQEFPRGWPIMRGESRQHIRSILKFLTVCTPTGLNGSEQYEASREKAWAHSWWIQQIHSDRINGEIRHRHLAYGYRTLFGRPCAYSPKSAASRCSGLT